MTNQKRRNNLFQNRTKRRRRASLLRGGSFQSERLEDRVLLATIVDSTTVDASGTLGVVGNLEVEFSTAVIGADLASSYTLHGAGADGLLGSADDSTIAVNPSYTGNIATLDFGVLAEDIYRLTVSDDITDSGSVQLDGDNDGNPGGDFTIDFVAGAQTHTLTSTHG
ncbi:MAG: hypothetical protein ACI9HK_005819, partial [Pirellulaceae bacterium]